MTTLKQIEANRRNAQSSTGPRTEAGKERSSRNAVRHGLTAETVIEPLEDAEDYQAFEEAVAAGFDAETAVERELILRLASLLWRLRRATSIETGLFKIGSASAARQPPAHNAMVRIVQSPSNSLANRAECAHSELAQYIHGDNRHQRVSTRDRHAIIAHPAFHKVSNLQRRLRTHQPLRGRALAPGSSDDFHIEHVAGRRPRRPLSKSIHWAPNNQV